jgi:transcriptional regulator
MRHNELYACSDPELVRALIERNPWATLVSRGEGAPVASHYPVIVDDACRDLAVLTHVGRPDERIHGFGSGEALLIVEGANGYISPSWYGPEATAVPTWNFTAAHCYGVPQVLAQEENLRVLARLVEHFERRVPDPALLDPEVGAKLVGGTVGIRLPITRFVLKVKMSQDDTPQTRRRVIDALRRPGPYENRALADDMASVQQPPAVRRSPAGTSE